VSVDVEMWRLLVGLMLLGLAACGDGAQKQEPQPATLPNGASYIPVAPAPQPTATPLPQPPEEPLPANPGPGGGGTADAACGAPTPPALSRINVRVHTSNSDHVMLDSTPLVGPDVVYCQQIGYTDGRAFCPARPDGHPQRVACEAQLVGVASDTGRVGPTWSES
jgi:hypothetical protein